MRPVLVAIQGDEPKSPAEIRDIVAAALNVSDEDRQLMLPSGKQALYTNRVAWAITHMAQAGLFNRPERGRYLLSERGKKVLQEHPDRVDLRVLQGFPEYQEFRTRKREKSEQKSVTVVVSDELSPSEAVGALVEDSYDTLAAELLDRILLQPPAFLETLALKLLRAMGYGGRESLLEHTGKPGDSGLDGVVRQDALGLDLVVFRPSGTTRTAPLGVQTFRRSSGLCRVRRQVEACSSRQGSSHRGLSSLQRTSPCVFGSSTAWN